MSCAEIDRSVSAPAFLLSGEDRTSLAFVDPSRIQDWTVAKIDDYTNRIQALKAVHNSAAGINRKLPADVLLEVFSQMKPHRWSQGWYNVLHVCRFWRQLLLRCPAFWVDVLRARRDLVGVNERSMARFTHFLDLARTRPLELSVVGLPQSAARVLSSHAHHISILEIEVNQKDVLLLQSLIAVGLPLLTRLSVGHRCDIRNSRDFPPLRLSCDKLPRLQSLRTPCQSACFIVGDVFARLRDIALYGCDCGFCRANKMPYCELLYKLTSCSALETLDLSNLCLRDVPLDGGDNAICLPSLRHLELSDDPPLMSVLLADLSLPRTCYVELSRLSRRFDDMLPEDSTLFHPLTVADRVVVDFNPDECATLQTYAQGSQLLRVVSSGQGPSDNPFFQNVCQIAHLFGPSNKVFDLTLRSAPPLGNSIGEHAVGLRALLSAFPRLLLLDTTAYDGTRDLLSTLGEKHQTGLYHCALLQYLSVQWRYQVLQPQRRSHWLHARPAPPVPYRTGPEALSAFCDAIVDIIKRRKGLALPLQTLSITVLPGEGGPKPSWTALVDKARERLREELIPTKLVQEIAVSYVPDAS